MNPRRRRLESDLTRLQKLAAQSTIFSFEVAHPMPSVGPPETYRLYFRGPGLQLTAGRGGEFVRPQLEHEVLVQLVAEYPRSAPHMRWLTPVFHPNISAAGAVCLGGWGTHWAPSLQLDRLCEMLWDMLRFANYDTRSPFNQQAALWLRSQRDYRFPLDQRELRDQPLPADSESPVQSASQMEFAPATLVVETDLHLPTDYRAPQPPAAEMRFEPTVHHLPVDEQRPLSMDPPNINPPPAGRPAQADPPQANPPYRNEPQPDILFLD